MTTPTPRNHYEALGLTRDASVADVRAAFRRLAMVYHPDKHPGDERAVELFRCINDAYRVLTDDVRRATYDRQLVDTPVDPGYESLVQPVKQVAKVGGPTARRGENILFDLEVPISKLLSGQPHILEYRYTRMDRCSDCAGSGHDPAVNAKPVSCESCAGTGLTEKTSGSLRLRQPCPDCHAGFRFHQDGCQICLGAGRMAQKRTIEVKVPANTAPGTTVRVARGGHAGAWGGDFGDLLLHLKAELPAGASADGANIIIRMPVDPVTLITGGFIRWDAAEDPIRIPAGTLPGETITLKKRGLPRKGGGDRGDMILRIDLEWPTKLSPKQMKALGAAREMFEDVNIPEMRNATRAVASILKK